MNLLYILLIIMLFMLLIFLINRQTNIIERFNERFNEKFKTRELSPFINFNLTDKPVANYQPYPIYNYWKYGHNFEQLDKYKNCNQYRCETDQLNGCTAQPGFNLVQGKYSDPVQNQSHFHVKNPRQQCAFYNNASMYCATNPHDDRCPNHWIK